MALLDDPVSKAADDLLGYAPFASIISEDIRRLDKSSGNVIAINGRWGSGKTSLIGMIVEALKQDARTTVVWFNPWMFSGAEELVTRFFDEISAQISQEQPKFLAISRRMARYGKAFASYGDLPVVGSKVKGVSSVMMAPERLREARLGSLHEQRLVISERLESLDTPIVVVVDDIDRLDHEELRELFKLVRLTGHFPNLIYLLAFDEVQTADALGQAGAEYIKKIVQISYYVPTIPTSTKRHVLVAMLEKSLFRELEGKKVHNDPMRSGAAVDLVIMPLMETMRDIKRFCIAATSVIPRLSEHVDLADLLSLVALQVARPDVLRYISERRNALTGVSTRTSFFGTPEEQNEHVQVLHDMIGAQADLARHFFALHFPDVAASLNFSDRRKETPESYLLKRRIAHVDVLSTFFDRVEAPGLTIVALAEQAFANFDSASALYDFLHSLPQNQVEDVVIELTAFGDRFETNMVRPACAALLDSLDLLPDDVSRSMFAPSPQSGVRRLVISLLELPSSSAETDSLVLDLFREVRSLSGKLELLKIVGSDQNHGGRSLVSADTWDLIRSELIDEIRKASDAQLGGEVNALDILFWAKGETTESSDPFTPEITQILAPVLLPAGIETTRELGGGITEQKFNPEGLRFLLGDDSRIIKLLTVCADIRLETEELQRYLRLGMDYFSLSSHSDSIRW